MDINLVTTAVVNQYLVGMSVLLCLVFIFLLVYVFWTRGKEKYWTQYRKKFRDYFFPLILTFLEEKEDPDFVILKLTKRTKDITFFLELLKELTEVIKGEERDKLNLLIEHKLFYTFYKQKLFSIFKRNQFIACIYFEHLSTIDTRVEARLVILSKSNNIKRSFAATKALQSSEHIIRRKNALIRFCKKEQASELMVAELLHLFYRKDTDPRAPIAKALIDVLNQKSILADKKNVIVLHIAHHGYYEYGDFLRRYLKTVQLSEDKVPLIMGLIQALGQLQVLEASPLIREYATAKYVDLQITCIEALGTLGGEENLTFLVKRLLQVPFRVRKTIIKVLVQHPSLGYRLLQEFLTANLGFIRQFKKQQNPPKELEEVVKKIHNTAVGIKTMLPNK